MTAPWVYRDPLEPKLTADVSPAALMQHVRTIGSWERESGSPGEAQAFDYIERTLKSYGVEVERREIEAYISLPQQARLTLPDGSVIEGLTHSFSTSVEALDAEVVDVGDGRPEDFTARGRQDRARARPGLAGPGVGRPAGGDARADLRPHGSPAQHDRDDRVGDAGARDGVADSGDARACRSSASTVSGCGRGWPVGRCACA